MSNERPSNGKAHPPRRAQRGLAGLMLAVLFLMLLWLPIMYWQAQLADEQRARDRQVKKLLEPIPAPVPASSPA